MSDTTILDGLAALPGWLKEQGARRILLITGPERRFVDQLPLDDFQVEELARAEVHVPRAVVNEASAAWKSSEADTIVSLGGGSATGLGKALRLEHEGVRFVAIPTTYAGSEMTNIYGIREDGEKNTGRDDRVRPDAVVHAPELFTSMPAKLTITSLLNALAHPISALSTGEVEGPAESGALRAIEDLVWALDQLLEAKASRDGRTTALRGATAAGRVLDEGSLGEHHEHAHALGGRHALPHSDLHAVLLPHTVATIAAEQPALYAKIAEAAGYEDLPAALYDMLTRAGAARSLIDLGVDSDADVPDGLTDALLGRRPSTRLQRTASGASHWGPSLEDARHVVIALHGRGANAGRMIASVVDMIGNDPTVAVVAPQAARNRWYPHGYGKPLAEHGDDLTNAIAAVNAELDRAIAAVGAERTFLVGFSQGACLASEVIARGERKIGGLVALAGARVGPRAEQAKVGALAGMPALFGISEGDPWVKAEDVRATADAYREAGADVTLVVDGGEAHEMSARQRILAQEILRGVSLRDGQSGFGNAHHGEALEGALPLNMNTPRRSPYGLYPEQINGTGFAAHRQHNLRTWFYRIRASAQHTPYTPLAHPTFVADWDDAPLDPNLSGHTPLEIPEAPTDFVDGIATYGGAGDPAMRRGFAIHLYVANRSMEHRSFYDADGDLLIVPQMGAFTLQTEFGVLDVRPGQVVIVPKGLKFSVLLHDGPIRGYIGEVYGRHFELPERGPVGSNGMTDPRHFVAPTPWFEDRLRPGYRLTAKIGNHLHEATQDHSPYDVVAWHGDYVPYVYDLASFSPVGNTRFDHPDPSIYTLFGAPMDEVGADTLDFVFFPPRWEVSEDTFRPPFFHRNGTTEFNGIITDPYLNPSGPFSEGCYFLTPSMTAHGVLAKAVHRAIVRKPELADKPVRVGDQSRWFQFETTLPIKLTRWARESADQIEDWPLLWGSYRSRFTPTK